MFEALRDPGIIAQWRAALGEGAVRDDDATLARYARSTQPHGTRPRCVLRPADRAQVQALVRIAAAHGAPLYPIARGKNWGYGDACAARDGAAIVDLSGMNRIVELDRELGYVAIEPGVSQQQLWRHLAEHAPEFWMDSTGAGPDASVMGNALERGFGHTPYGDHLRSCCGMEIVLADARVLRTGFGHYAGARAYHVYPYGIGPYLDGLFTQSNFGIVTQMGLWLYPKPEAFRFFYVRVDREDALEPLVDALRPLRMQGQLNSAVHIGNDLRIVSATRTYPFGRTGGATPLPRAVREALRQELGAGAWNVSGALTGTPATVRDAARRLRRAMGPLGHIVFVDDAKLALGRRAVAWMRRLGLGARLGRQLDALAPNYGLLQGAPTPWPIGGTHWRLRNPPEDLTADPLDCGAGLLWVSPVLPLRGADARRVLDIAAPMLERHGFDTLLTFTLLNERSMVAVFNISFDHAAAGEDEAAAACYAALLDALREAGYISYRASPLGMTRLRPEGDAFWEVAAAFKRAVDPHDLIAPGRYIPPIA